ncbi:MAG: diphthine--ammonia ligase [Candidatus Diapherotrites archaeon]|uniref:Diphthine--ammonia ligase n=1 Tax=Candidatus Iainarchaeum sp. TaxID=3101447 RepID=A0A938YSE1_9ARCH|nr:diphthine--ammonia ligase [Candidatus Diapherotrites archaeon]
MNVACLFSGGKDSCYSLFNAINQNHTIAGLITIKSRDSDSFMYHLPNIHLTEQAALASELPLIIGEAEKGQEAELWVLYDVLAELKNEKRIDGVLTGAIASNYQRKRVDLLCKKLKLKHLAPLWGRNQAELLREMIEHRFSMLVVAVAAKGLGESWLGRAIDESAVDELLELQEKFGINVAGEGGELETLVLDCPLFKKKLVVCESEKKWNGVRGELRIKKVDLAEK